MYRAAAALASRVSRCHSLPIFYKLFLSWRDFEYRNYHVVYSFYWPWTYTLWIGHWLFEIFLPSISLNLKFSPTAIVEFDLIISFGFGVVERVLH